jgi:hypothetical protein
LDEERGKASVLALRRYIEELLVSTNSIELYACWEGERISPYPIDFLPLGTSLDEGSFGELLSK